MKIKIIKIALALLAFIPSICKVAHAQEPDKALLARFEVLCKKISDAEGNYTLGGIINIIDNANPADQMDHIPFLFCKKGDEFYYQLGKTETINQQGVYLVVDHPARRVMLSAQKSITYDTGMKQLADIGANIKAENYKLTSTIAGDEQTISLTNDHHITCKQYSIVFNKNTMQIKRLFTRLTNFSDPLNKEKDKLVNVSITKWEHTADLANYPTKSKIVKNIKGNWAMTDQFKSYRLIKI